MFFKYAILFCVVLLFVDTEGFVKRDIDSPSTPAFDIDALKKNMDQFKNCLDQSLAGVVGQVNEKQLQPLFNIIGDHLNRFSKAFVDITAPKSSTSAYNK